MSSLVDSCDKRFTSKVLRNQSSDMNRNVPSTPLVQRRVHLSVPQRRSILSSLNLLPGKLKLADANAARKHLAAYLTAR